MEIKNYALFAILSFFFQNVYAASLCDTPSASEDARIYFGNGINNDKGDIDDSIDELQEAIAVFNDDAYGKAVNTSENFVLDFYQSVKQRVDSLVLFWIWFYDISLAPKWYQDEYISMINGVSSVSYANDLDLQNMVVKYLVDLRCLDGAKRKRKIEHIKRYFWVSARNGASYQI